MLHRIAPVLLAVLLVGAVQSPASGRAASRSRAPWCSPSDLRVVYTGSNGATQHVALSIQVRAVVRCAQRGYPGIRLIGRHGRQLATRGRWTGRNIFGRTRERRIVLAPHRPAVFVLVLDTSALSTAPASCHRLRAIQVILPDEYRRRRLHVYDRSIACRRMTISPLTRGGR